MLLFFASGLTAAAPPSGTPYLMLLRGVGVLTSMVIFVG